MSSRPIIVEQSSSIIAHGTTGLHIWPACTQLIWYLDRHQAILSDKCVLELGAGVGLLGLTCLKSGVKHYAFSDSHRLVLDQLEKNLVYNEVDSERASAVQLDWTIDLREQEDVVNNQNLLNLDLILATGN